MVRTRGPSIIMVIDIVTHVVTMTVVEISVLTHHNPLHSVWTNQLFIIYIYLRDPAIKSIVGRI
jgi:hypothetical protein